MLACICNPSTGVLETGKSLKLAANQISLLSKIQTHETLSPQTARWEAEEIAQCMEVLALQTYGPEFKSLSHM